MSTSALNKFYLRVLRSRERDLVLGSLSTATVIEITYISFCNSFNRSTFQLLCPRFYHSTIVPVNDTWKNSRYVVESLYSLSRIRKRGNIHVLQFREAFTL